MTPKIQTKGSAGADLCASEHVYIPAGESRVIGTGYLWHVDNHSWCGLVIQRSGLWFKHGVTCPVGLIDSDYVGKEVKVRLLNTGTEGFHVNPGDRIAQLLVVSQLTEYYFEALQITRADGFGSTGV